MPKSCAPYLAEQAVEVLSEEGLAGMAKALELLLNEVMRADRSRIMIEGGHRDACAASGGTRRQSPEQLLGAVCGLL